MHKTLSDTSQKVVGLGALHQQASTYKGIKAHSQEPLQIAVFRASHGTENNLTTGRRRSPSATRPNTDKDQAKFIGVRETPTINTTYHEIASSIAVLKRAPPQEYRPL